MTKPIRRLLQTYLSTQDHTDTDDLSELERAVESALIRVETRTREVRRKYEIPPPDPTGDQTAGAMLV